MTKCVDGNLGLGSVVRPAANKGHKILVNKKEKEACIYIYKQCTGQKAQNKILCGI